MEDFSEVGRTDVGWHSPLVLWDSNSTQHWQQGGAGAVQVSEFWLLPYML